MRCLAASQPMDDIVLQAKKPNGKQRPEVSYGDVVDTLQAIYQNNRQLKA